MTSLDFEILDASLTLGSCSKEQKKSIVRLMEICIEETIKEYTDKAEIELPAERLEILQGDVFYDKGFWRHIIWCFAKRFDIGNI